MHEEIHGEGESLLNIRLQRQCDGEMLIARVREQTSDTSWKLECGDIVYVDTDVYPSIVIRVGYGHYEKEVRVAGVKDNLNDWKVGHWVGTDRCFKLEIGDKLVAVTDITDATESRRQIPQGTECKYSGRDNDGDVLIAVGRRAARFIIFKEGIDKLTLQ